MYVFSKSSKGFAAKMRSGGEISLQGTNTWCHWEIAKGYSIHNTPLPTHYLVIS